MDFNQFRRKLLNKYWISKTIAFGPNRAIHELTPAAYFVWIPKAAGSSIAAWLRRTVGLTELHNVGRILNAKPGSLAQTNALTVGHQDTDALIRLKLLTPEQLDQSHSFAIVRNPFSRLISNWIYLKKIGKIALDTSLDTFVKEIYRQRPTPGAFNQYKLSMASRMVDWINQKEWNGPQEIFQLENLSRDFSKLQNALDSHSPLPRRNIATIRQNVVFSISRDSLGRIQDFYSQDFSQFGYAPDELPPNLEAR